MTLKHSIDERAHLEEEIKRRGETISSMAAQIERYKEALDEIIKSDHSKDQTFANIARRAWAGERRMELPDRFPVDLKQAIIRLADALCAWERNTGCESALIILEDGGYEYLSLSGKPAPKDATISDLIGFIKNN